MTLLDPDRAPGGTELEILPMCGVAALGARGASDPKARCPSDPRATSTSAAEDLRYRVRDEVPRALRADRERAGAPLVDDVKGWMDGFFPSRGRA